MPEELSQINIADSLHISVTRAGQEVPDTPGQMFATPWAGTRIRDIIRDGMPRRGLAPEVNRWRLRNQRHLWRGAWKLLFARLFRQHRIYGTLWIDVLRADGSMERYGLASLELVTTVGCNFIVDAWQNIVELEIMKYHAIGTTNTTPVIGDTAMAAESTTALSPASTRATGTLAEGASANIFRTVGTLTAGSTIAAVETGLFSTSGTGTGVLMDRFVYSTVTLAAGDTITTTIEITIPPGS